MTTPSSFFILPSRQRYVNADGTPTREFFVFLTNLVNSFGGGQPLGTAAFSNTGTSGNAVPLLNSANTWSGVQTFEDGDITLKGATSGSTSLHALAVASGSIIFPNATDTVAVLDAAQEFTNKIIPSVSNTLDVIQVVGTATSDSASPGNLGEIIESNIPIGSEVGLTSTNAADITSISLTGGDWDVWGTVAFDPAGTTTMTSLQGWISTTSATRPTFPGNGAIAVYNHTFTSGADQVFPVGQMRITLPTGPTTVFLSCNSVFGTSTLKAYGYIGARRRR